MYISGTFFVTLETNGNNNNCDQSNDAIDDGRPASTKYELV